jgi:Mor family transcriptional regulator
MSRPAKWERNQEILRRWRYGEKVAVLALEFGVSVTTIVNIIQRMRMIGGG